MIYDFDMSEIDSLASMAGSANVSKPNDGFTSGWGNWASGIKDVVSGGIALATEIEAFKQFRDGEGQQKMLNTPTTDYNPKLTQQGTASSGGFSINQNTLVTGALVVVAGVVLVNVIKG